MRILIKSGLNPLRPDQKLRFGTYIRTDQLREVGTRLKLILVTNRIEFQLHNALSDWELLIVRSWAKLQLRNDMSDWKVEHFESNVRMDSKTSDSSPDLSPGRWVPSSLLMTIQRDVTKLEILKFGSYSRASGCLLAQLHRPTWGKERNKIRLVISSRSVKIQRDFTRSKENGNERRFGSETRLHYGRRSGRINTAKKKVFKSKYDIIYLETDAVISQLVHLRTEVDD